MTLKNAVVKLLKEYVILEKLKDEFQVLPATKEEAAPFVMKHYLEAWPSGIKRIYGIYHKVETGRQMVGVIIYGVPFMTTAKFLEPEVKHNETLELKRLFIDDIGIKNLESFSIGQSLKLLKRDEPQIKVVITFADDLQKHKGIIYQATNAIYLGFSGAGKHKYIYIIGGNENAIRSKIQTMVKQYPKKIQETLNYNDIGHNPSPSESGNRIWMWKNAGEEFTILPVFFNIHLSKSGDFEGRYDKKKNMVSIVDMNSLENNLNNTQMENVPENLIRRLKFEFGDNIQFKTFFEENIQRYPKKIGETLTYTDIGHRNNESWIWFWDNKDEEFTAIPVSKGKSHYTSGIDSDFQGRFDPVKNMVSIVDMNTYGKNDYNVTEMKNVPLNLLRRLKYQFGDDIKFKTFFEENTTNI